MSAAGSVRAAGPTPPPSTVQPPSIPTKTVSIGSIKTPNSQETHQLYMTTQGTIPEGMKSAYQTAIANLITTINFTRSQENKHPLDLKDITILVLEDGNIQYCDGERDETTGKLTFVTLNQSTTEMKTYVAGDAAPANWAEYKTVADVWKMFKDTLSHLETTIATTRDEHPQELTSKIVWIPTQPANSPAPPSNASSQSNTPRNTPPPSRRRIRRNSSAATPPHSDSHTPTRPSSPPLQNLFGSTVNPFAASAAETASTDGQNQRLTELPSNSEDEPLVRRPRAPTAAPSRAAAADASDSGSETDTDHLDTVN
jgi:hypothetical protein